MKCSTRKGQAPVRYPAPDTTSRPSLKRSPRLNARSLFTQVEKDTQYTTDTVAKLFKMTIQNILDSSEGVYDMRYAHALLLNSELGIMDGLMPDAFSRCPYLFKANTHDPDTPTFSKAMTGLYRAEFKKAMQKNK